MYRVRAIYCGGFQGSYKGMGASEILGKTEDEITVDFLKKHTITVNEAFQTMKVNADKVEELETAASEHATELQTANDETTAAKEKFEKYTEIIAEDQLDTFIEENESAEENETLELEHIIPMAQFGSKVLHGKKEECIRQYKLTLCTNPLGGFATIALACIRPA